MGWEFSLSLDETVRRTKRFFKILGGFTLLLVGAIMLFTPGPGWLVILMGLPSSPLNMSGPAACSIA